MKGRPTPKRDAQRKARRAAAIAAREASPQLTALYDLFVPPIRRKGAR